MHKEWAEKLFEEDDLHLNPINVFHPNVFAADEVIENIDLEIKDPVVEWWEEGPLSAQERVDKYLKDCIELAA